jgi:HAD superfamily hydrolase (TIGR01509 family)
MDGLMLDTEAPAIAAWLKAARDRGWEVARETALRTVGLDEDSTREVIREACGPGFPYDEVRQAMVDAIIEGAERRGIPQKPGLMPLLDRAAERGIPLGVATSSSQEAALWKLNRGGIPVERFAVITCGNEVRRGKPAPDIFLLAAKRLGVPPEHCVGFEDSPAGIRGLYDAGIKPVFIQDLVSPPPEVLAKVWRSFPSLGEALSIL